MLQDMHLHSKYSDGINTPVEMIETAISVGIEKMCFTDHVWRTSTWIPQYVDELLRLSERYADKIEILCGVEAKLLDCQGHLDVPDEALDRHLRIVGAMHRIPLENGEFLRRSEISNYASDYVREAWLTAFQAFKYNAQVECVAHPFSLFSTIGISVKDDSWWETVSKEVSLLPCMIEYNVKYDNTMVPEWFWKRHSDKIITGTDSHSIEDMQIRVNELRLVSKRINRFLKEK